MVLASFPLAETWQSLRNLVSKQWRFCHKIILQYPVVPKGETDGLSQCCFNTIIPITLKKILPLLRPIPSNNAPPHCCKLLTSWSSRTWPLDQSLPFHSKSHLLPAHGLLYPPIFLPLLVLSSTVSSSTSLRFPASQYPPPSFCCLSVLS